ncbi:uncharacterized protein AMSG_11694 [Thecamonas trahens ATCC 50062]|uniref:FG-GAP repeat protein n=1 Tax=Thecamonas trahens ATCC 50062 TaxID=461836 RepID=A0A0L0DXC6_THETB|nr:hypothetical protein AMSG_11694 [Thecamonas trahens ATCC 50062]KNC56183.1 hypothetical protein AMSG_11694 [Thecamonas trahens ATCC 50062]|eukprot:XP_013761233.1 hypothetical protein AMSG_11694 [Thecamonas trahens ATCC 50062]
MMGSPVATVFGPLSSFIPGNPLIVGNAPFAQQAIGGPRLQDAPAFPLLLSTVVIAAAPNSSISSTKVYAVTLQAPLPAPPSVTLLYSFSGDVNEWISTTVLDTTAVVAIGGTTPYVLSSPLNPTPFALTPVLPQAPSSGTQFNTLVSGDLNGDGLDDFVAGGSSTNFADTGLLMVAIAEPPHATTLPSAKFSIYAILSGDPGVGAFSPVFSIALWSLSPFPSIVAVSFPFAFAASPAQVFAVRFDPTRGASSHLYGLSLLYDSSNLGGTGMISAPVGTPLPHTPLVLASPCPTVPHDYCAMAALPQALPITSFSQTTLAGLHAPLSSSLWTLGLIDDDTETDLAILIDGVIHVYLNNIVAAAASSDEPAWRHVTGPSITAYRSGAFSIVGPVLADVDADGDLDLVLAVVTAAGSEVFQLAYFANIGSGHFAIIAPLAITTGVSFNAIADSLLMPLPLLHPNVASGCANLPQLEL